MDALPLRERVKTLAFIGLLETNGPHLPRPYADLLKNGIHELRIKLTGTQVRILYFFCFQNIIVLTNIFEKHTNTVPESEIKLAMVYRADFFSRYSEMSIKEAEK
ncbi:MAG: type II toxin-antitoxin system RelE/ParE family toxin [Spirochaetaceae bacterium]|nr:type II toxin-antitoxin system RelE/ParE family toxin [Spirochaetaceae bacterium]